MPSNIESVRRGRPSLQGISQSLRFGRRREIRSGARGPSPFSRQAVIHQPFPLRSTILRLRPSAPTAALIFSSAMNVRTAYLLSHEDKRLRTLTPQTPTRRQTPSTSAAAGPSSKPGPKPAPRPLVKPNQSLDEVRTNLKLYRTSTDCPQFPPSVPRGVLGIACVSSCFASCPPPLGAWSSCTRLD